MKIFHIEMLLKYSGVKLLSLKPARNSFRTMSKQTIWLGTGFKNYCRDVE